MIKKIILLLALYILLTFGLTAQLRNDQNGYWWKNVGEMGQMPFITGFFDGLSLGANITLEKFDQNSLCFRDGVKSFEKTKMLDTMIALHLFIMMDSLYTDSINLCIKCNHMFWVAANIWIDTPRNEIDKMIEKYRKEDCIALDDKKK